MGRGGEENSFKGQFLLYVREITNGLTPGRGTSAEAVITYGETKVNEGGEE